MSLCVAGITALQLYYSYENYKFAERVFKKDANEALLEARDSSIVIHNNGVMEKFVKWMNDTSFVKIRCRYIEEQKTTQFLIKEVNPNSANGQTEVNLSIEEITERVDTITPKIKKIFIDHMVRTVDSGLEKGTVWFFTQALGDSLSKAYYQTPIDEKIITDQYRLALARREINMPFSFKKNPKITDFSTRKVNMSVDKPRWMQARFVFVNAYLLGKLKWVIIGSLVLIVITLACFWYTARTLLSQHKLNRMKDDFISNMTHEIHTPLASLLVTAEALKRFSHDEASRESYIDIILHQGGRLSALTEEILNDARLEKKGIAMDDEVEANMLIENILLDDEYKTVQFQASATEVQFTGNAFHLGNAIRNLIDNALKYNMAPDTWVEVTCKVSGSLLIIEVADNGHGIPDSHKQKVFGPFYRVPSGNVHNVKGYGLGLSYVKKVIEAHKGSISIKDNQPSGAIFIIKLPL